MKRWLCSLVAILLAFPASPAYADNCSGLGDCNAQVGTWAAIIAGLVIAGFILWWAWPAIAAWLAASGEGAAIAGAETTAGEIGSEIAAIEGETAAGETVTTEVAAADQPPLRIIHSLETLERDSNITEIREMSTQEIVESLEPGAEDPLLVRPDGAVFDGNTRLTVLQERGYNINDLPRTVYNPDPIAPWEE